jgi:tyrosyl-tRNA synthetase
MQKFLDFEGPNAAILVNNLDFYREMDILAFLRDVGKTLTVNYMMSKDSVKNRLETGLSFTEFSYQLLQAYDFQVLYTKHNCVLQMGGSDQWGNITSGTEFIRRNADGKAYAITTPLLTKADGSKFGKSEQGNIWLDADLTSPYRFYQFWINADDADLPKYMRYFTLKSEEEVLELEKEYADNPRKLKEILAEELTRRVHSDDEFHSVQLVSNLLFSKDASPDTCKMMSPTQLATVAEEIPSAVISRSTIEEGIILTELMAHTGISPSKTEARKAVQNNAVSINKVKISNFDTLIDTSHLLHNKYVMLENGKKNKQMLVVQP